MDKGDGARLKRLLGRPLGYFMFSLLELKRIIFENMFKRV